MDKPKKRFVIAVELSDWLRKEPWNFMVIAINFHSCKYCSNLKISLLGIGLMIGFADTSKMNRRGASKHF